MINKIELAEKFNEIFTDKEIVHYFHEWYEERREKEDMRTWWQKYCPLIIFIGCITLLFGSLFYYSYRPRVEQDIYKTNNEMDLWTTVYYKGEIVKMWFIPMDKLTDSAKQHHKEAGEALLKTLEK